MNTTNSNLASDSMFVTTQGKSMDLCVSVGVRPGLDFVNRFAESNKATHIVVLEVPKILHRSLFYYEAFKLRAISKPALRDADLCEAIRLRINGGYSRVSGAVYTELCTRTCGPRSIVIRKTKPQDDRADGGIAFWSLSHTRILADQRIVLQFAQVDSLMQGHPFRVNDIPSYNRSDVLARRFDSQLLRGATLTLSTVKKTTPNIAFVFELTNWNFQAFWGRTPWCTTMNLSSDIEDLHCSDIYRSLSVWGNFDAVCENEALRQGMLSAFSGPRIVCQALVRQLDRMGISSLNELALELPSINDSIQRELEFAFPGWKYMSKSMVTFCIIVRSSEFSLHQLFPECIMRLTKGGLLDIRAEASKGLCYFAPFFPMLTDRMAGVLGVTPGCLNEILRHMSKDSASNEFAMWQNWVMLELLQISSRTLWVYLRQKYSLEPTHSGFHEISSLQGEFMEPNATLRELRSGTLYILEPFPYSTSMNLRGFAFRAHCCGRSCQVLLKLEVEGVSGSNIEALVARKSGNASTDSPKTSKAALCGTQFEDFAILTVCASEFKLLFAQCRESESNGCSVDIQPYTSAGNYVLDRLFDGFRIKTPWCDMSRRSRVYNHYMCENLRVKYASGRIALRQHKTTGLSYMATAQEVMKQLGLSRYELSLYKTHSDSFRTQHEIRATHYVKSVRQLVRYLLEWGTEIAEVIQTRKLLKRNRIFYLDRQVDCLIESSGLAVGTKLALKAVLQNALTC